MEAAICSSNENSAFETISFVCFEFIILSRRSDLDFNVEEWKYYWSDVWVEVTEKRRQSANRFSSK